MTETPQDPNQPPPGYPAAPPPPPPPPGPQGGWGAAPAPVPAAGGYGAPAPYAEWIKRVGGYLVDVAVLVPAYLVGFLGAAIASADNDAMSIVGALIAIAGYLAAIGVAIWNMIFRQGRTGWSIGKQVVGIRLLKEDTGQPMGAGMCFVRAIAHIVDAIPCYIGFLWPLWDAKRQTFADKIMTTVVVQQKKS